MKELFTNADLSEITPSNNLCYVSDILHTITINVGPNKSSYSRKYRSNMDGYNIDYNKAKTFVANIPFMYYIRYKPTNAIICLGEYY